jgi:hypothetical protein
MRQHNAEQYGTLSSLPEIDLVEIVDLRAVDGDARDYMSKGRSAPTTVIYGADAQNIAKLLRTLQPGKQSRCHTPPFGFRFYHGDYVMAEASVCWKCDNIFGMIGGRTFFFEFDSSHANAQQLLTEAQRLTGIVLIKNGREG